MNLVAVHIAPPCDMLKKSKFRTSLIIVIPAGFCTAQGYDVTVFLNLGLHAGTDQRTHTCFVDLERQINKTRD